MYLRVIPLFSPPSRGRRGVTPPYRVDVGVLLRPHFPLREGITKLTKPWVVGVRSDPCRPRRIHAVTRIKQTSARDWSRYTGGQVSEAMRLDPRTTLSHRYDHAAVSKRCARDDDR